MTQTSRRVLRVLLIGALLIGSIAGLTWYLFEQVPNIESEASLFNNLGFFLLININIVIVMVLGFIVVKNLVMLILDRRRGIWGAKLRSRLVGAFIGLALIPTVLLFLVAKGIVERVLEGWFSPQMMAAVDGAVAVLDRSQEATETRLYRQLHQLGELVTAASPSVLGTVGAPYLERDDVREVVLELLRMKREEYGLFHLALVDESGKTLLEAASVEAAEVAPETLAPNLARVQEALAGHELLVHLEPSIEGQVIRGYAPVFSDPAPGSNSSAHQWPARYSIVITEFIPAAINDSATSVLAASDDYRELQIYRRPLASSYILMLVVFTMMIVFAAVWFGFYLARGISVPIQLLADGTAQIAQGNLQYRIPEVGDDELSVLVRSFNKMTEDLRGTTDELIARRRYMETVLGSLSVGVVSVDREFRITTLNTAAATMFSLGDPTKAISGALDTVLSAEAAEKMLMLLQELYRSEERMMVENVSLHVKNSPKQLQMTVTKLVSESGELLGSVILLEDVTELVNAQRMAAWREVARRVAHEIKNPLTPIQLSAQRIQRKFGMLRGERTAEEKIHPMLSEKDRGIIGECTATIIKQVDTLRLLVNEFSRFARMPKVNLEQAQINEIIQETIPMYRSAHPEIEFVSQVDRSIPEFELDREQLARALTNLLDNAVSAVQSKRERRTPIDSPGHFTLIRRIAELLGIKLRATNTVVRGGEADDGFHPRIELRSHLNSSLGIVAIEVSDNGPGISESDQTRLFEPYFSTKQGGTGLGLAIVSSIVADHHGFIRYRNNVGGGAVFRIELPIASSVPRGNVGAA